MFVQYLFWELYKIDLKIELESLLVLYQISVWYTVF